MPKYRKRPVTVDAIQWTGENVQEIAAFTGIDVRVHEGYLLIPTLEGVMQASEGDYIIKGVQSEFYPCKPDIFEKTYERVED